MLTPGQIVPMIPLALEAMDLPGLGIRVVEVRR